MKDFLLGIVIGSLVVGSSVQRTIAVDRGKLRQSIISSIVNGLSYFFSVLFIASDNYIAFVGTVFGSTAIVAYMAWRNKNG